MILSQSQSFLIMFHCQAIHPLCVLVRISFSFATWVVVVVCYTCRKCACMFALRFDSHFIFFRTPYSHMTQAHGIVVIAKSCISHVEYTKTDLPRIIDLIFASVTLPNKLNIFRPFFSMLLLHFTDSSSISIFFFQMQLSWKCYEKCFFLYFFFISSNFYSCLLQFYSQWKCNHRTFGRPFLFFFFFILQMLKTF